MADIYDHIARFEECNIPQLDTVRIGTTNKLLTAPCPWCGQSHPHGAGSDFKPGEMLVDRGSRVADQCFDEYAYRIGLRSYNLVECTSVAHHREAFSLFGVLADRPLISRLHPKIGQHAPMMVAIARTMFPGARVDAGRYRLRRIVAVIDEKARRIYLGRDGSWFMSSQANDTKVLARGDNLLQALAMLSGMSAGHMAEKVLFATTGCFLGDLTGSAFRYLIDQHAGLAEISGQKDLVKGPQVLFRMIGGGSVSCSSQVPPVMETLFTLLLPGSGEEHGTMEYKNAQRKISIVVLPSGKWVGLFPYPGSGAGLGQPVHMQGRSILSLLSALTGLGAGWYAERILTTGLGLDLPANVRSQLANGLTEFVGQATVRDELEGSV
ncbi:hypothetical protein [Roseibium alexandrii]